MGIPIVAEIWDGVRWIIDFFINKVPRPVKFLFFLLMLLLFGVILQFTFHLFGVHCDDDHEVVKVDSFDLTTNIQVIWVANSDPLPPNATQSEVHPEFWSDRGFGLCSDYLVQTDEGCWEFCTNTSDANCKHYYRRPNCYDCTPLDIMMCGVDTQLLGDSRDRTVCASDVRERVPEWTIFESIFQCSRYCHIPDGYYFDYESSNYVCEDLDVCGINVSNDDRPTRLKELLDDANAERMYTSDDKDAFNMLQFKCIANSYNPSLTVFGIPIFDYRTWLIIAVIFVMFIFLTKLPLRRNG
jgi:hypothetical protein